MEELIPKPSDGAGAKTPPAIRTMKSDVAEFLKEKKPSLVSVLSEQVKLHEPTPQSAPARPSYTRALTLIGALAFLAAIVGGAFVWYGSGKRAEPGKTREVAPPGFIFSETIVEHTIALNRQGVLKAITDSMGRPNTPAGSFTRIVLRTREDGDVERVLNAPELFEIIGAEPPAGFLDATTGPPQLFLQRAAMGFRIALIFETKNRARSLQALRSWEPALADDLRFLFLTEKPAVRLDPFADLAYRNIDIRYLALDPAQDLGIGYLYFPAGNRIIIATSQETIITAIERLFERR